MLPATRRRMSWAVVASVVVHAAVLTVLALQRPMLVLPVEEAGPPAPIIPILLVPRTPPPTVGQKAKPQPIRLHRRPQRFLPPEVPTVPIAPPAPAAPAAPAQASRGPVALHPAPQPEGPSGDVRTALRQGTVGCANPLAVGLNRAERDLCDEKFGKGAKAAAFPGLGLAAEKLRALDAASAKKEADKKYKDSYGPPGDASAAGEATTMRIPN